MTKFNIQKTTKFLMITGAILFVVAAILYTIKPTRQLITRAPIETRVSVSAGDTLSTILSKYGVSGSDINIIAGLLKKDCGVHGLRANSDVLVIQKSDESAPVDKITLSKGPWQRVDMICDENGKWRADVVSIEKDTRLVRKTGKIPNGGVFSQTGVDAGIPIGVVYEIINLLAFEIDFERDIQPGQEFKVLYEENLRDGQVVDGGRVIAIEFDTHLSRRGKLKMYRYEKDNGKFGYYDEDGKGAIKSLKRTPIDGASISSKFNPNRKHPVLGYTRAHKGVDFRARTGTKIPAAGDGRVVARSFNRGHGNFVKIRHTNGFETLYAHMSKFQKGVNVGTRVIQGQIIGYVGSTGISTGPHLHYEIIKNGKHVNPMTVTFPRIDDLTAAQKKDFIKVRKNIDKADKTLAEYPNLFIPM
ncbi:MAG: peptidoglycan DD-metalloendopeptidase family protein [Rickettsiales bacterium]|jgi:murein DD-endopeptidase MepM/ murein hydrolase activator NlpD|nr:peptidoglycan DD-metalloendopeptidase family protein [Rickettsiales bacterium]